MSEVLIFVNGSEQAIEAGSSLTEIITAMRLEGRRIAVERNEIIVPKSAYSSVVIDQGDRLEIVHAIGGG